MNLMTEVIENIYKYGNAIVEYQNNKFESKIVFYVGKNDKLNIKLEQYYRMDGMKLEAASFDNLSAKEGFRYIVLLVYYTLVDGKREEDNVIISYDAENYNSKYTETAINELYQQLLPMLSTEGGYIKNLTKSRSIYESMVNQNSFVADNSENKNVKYIITSLESYYSKFKQTLVNAYTLWKNVVNGSDDTSLDKWDAFLNQLDKPKTIDSKNKELKSSDKDLDVINICYEFLTSKNYITDPAVDSEETIENLEIALLTNSKSAILVGLPGVGKTAITEGLAYRISKGQVPTALKNKRILKIDIPSIVSGCILVGMFEDKVEKIMNYLMDNPDTILFLDEIHTAIGAGTGSRFNIDLANIIKPYIDRGDIKIIGATTEEEYEEYIKNDKAFNRRFKKVNVIEPKNETVYKIVNETIKRLEKVTNVKWNFDNEKSIRIVKYIVDCTDEKNRIWNDKRYNPDISITILETAFAIAELRDDDSVRVEYVSEAIRRSEFLYENVRNSLASGLVNKFNNNAKKPTGKSKIIVFPSSITNNSSDD